MGPTALVSPEDALPSEPPARAHVLPLRSPGEPSRVCSGHGLSPILFLESEGSTWRPGRRLTGGLPSRGVTTARDTGSGGPAPGTRSCRHSGPWCLVPGRPALTLTDRERPAAICLPCPGSPWAGRPLVPADSTPSTLGPSDRRAPTILGSEPTADALMPAPSGCLWPQQLPLRPPALGSRRLGSRSWCGNQQARGGSG